MQAVGIIGAVIMPHNIYLHSALVLSRSIDRTRPEKSEANFYFTLESTLALIVSFLINGAVVAVFGEGFYSEKCAGLSEALTLLPDHQVVEPPFACVPLSAGTVHSNVHCSVGGVEGSCAPIGLQGAASALQHGLGSSSKVLWAIGLLAAGQSATMTGTYAGQYVMEGFLKITLPNFVRLAITRAIALVPATLVAVVANTDSLAADKLDEWLNVLQSVQIPFAILPLLRFTSDYRIMGDFVNSYRLTAAGWTCAIIILIINVYLVGSSAASFGVFDAPWSLGVFLLACCAYGYILWRVVAADVRKFVAYCRSGHRYAPLRFDDDDEGEEEAPSEVKTLLNGSVHESSKYGSTTL